MSIKSFDHLGQQAYEAYATAQLKRCGRSQAIHPWVALKAADQACWVAAAMRVAEEVNCMR